MNNDETFRWVLVVGSLIVVPIAVYYRLRSQATGEKLDRRQEGLFILFTLRPLGIAGMLGLIAYMINPKWMEWSSIAIPTWLRWLGVVVVGCSGILLVWTFRNLGQNLTDTVVTRRDHTLVTSGPYRYVRHPFYLAFALGIFGGSVAMANWFILLAGVFPFGFLVARTRIEEAKLLERFGVEYRDYMRRVGRFLPRFKL